MEGQQRTEGDDEQSEDERYVQLLRPSAWAGFAAFLVLAAVARLVVWLEDPGGQFADQGFERSSFSALPEASEMLLWVLFQAHGVGVTVTPSRNEPELSGTIAEIAVVDPGIMYVVVPVSLLSAGCLAVIRADPVSVRDASIVGAGSS